MIAYRQLNKFQYQNLNISHNISYQQKYTQSHIIKLNFIRRFSELPPIQRMYIPPEQSFVPHDELQYYPHKRSYYPSEQPYCPSEQPYCPLGIPFCPREHSYCPSEQPYCPLEQTYCPLTNLSCDIEQLYENVSFDEIYGFDYYERYQPLKFYQNENIHENKKE